MEKTTIFKFTNINQRLYDTLINNRLYFSNPSDFNDPYDVNLFNDDEDKETVLHNLIVKDAAEGDDFSKNYDLYKEKLGVDSIYDRLKVIVRDLMNEQGICCFSTNQGNLLLWSHYANSHKGVCLTFNYQKLGYNFSSRSRVIYTKEYPTISFTDLNSAAKTILTTKSEDWSYESEVRFFSESSGLYEYPIEALEEITFGAKVKDEDISTIVKMVKCLGYSHTKFFKSSLSKVRFEIELNFID